MNLFGSPRYTHARIIVSPELEGGGTFCQSESRILGQVTHSLLLADRKWVRLVYKGERGGSPHLDKLAKLDAILRGARFGVADSFESPPEHLPSSRPFRKEIRISRPKHNAISLREPLEIRSGEDTPSGLIAVWASFDYYRINAWSAIVSEEALSHALRWLGQFSDSIGYRLTDFHKEPGGFRLQFRRDSTDIPLFPLGDFTQANHWRTLSFFLTRLLGKFCTACGGSKTASRPGSFLSWCPVIFDDDRQGQLVTFEGLDQEQLRIKKRELGAQVLAEGPVAVFFVPAERWNDAPNGVFRLWIMERQGRYRHFPPLPRPYPRTVARAPPSYPTVRGDIPIGMTPLGGGQEIGANSFLLSIGRKHLLLDCGQDVAVRGSNPLGLPRLDHLQPLCAILLSHAHTDHVGAVLTAHTLFPDVPIYCTAETLEILRVSILHHTSESFVERREEQLGAPLPPSKIWDDEFDRALRVVPYGFDVPIDRMPGVTFRFIPAGHILGAASIGLMIGDRKILYTGDFCLSDQATVPGSRLPEAGSWDTVISESTNGAGHREVVTSVDSAVDSLHTVLAETVASGGTALLPAFSLGKAQEVYALLTKALAKYWPAVPLRRVRVEGLARNFFPVYSSFNPNSGLPPEPEHLGRLDPATASATVKRMLADGPNFIIATHGMMLEGTISHSLGVSLLRERRATIITTGYQAPGSLGGELQQFGRPGGSPDKRVYHESLPHGSETPICAIKELRISGHAPLPDLLETITRLSPKNVVLVHGSVEAIAQVKTSLDGLLDDTEVVAPTNLETISLGVAHLPAEAAEEWRKTRGSLPEIHPDFVLKARSKRKPPSSDRQLPPLTISLAQVGRPLPARDFDGRTHVNVPLSPRILKAAIRIGPKDGGSLSDYDSIKFAQLLPGTHKTLIEYSHEKLVELTEQYVPLSIFPGEYLLHYSGRKQSRETLVRVVLNFEDEEEWVLESGGDLTVDIPMLEGHTRLFHRIEVEDRSMTQDRGILFNGIPMGDRLRLEFKDTENRHRECRVIVRFREPYVNSIFKLVVGASGPRTEDLIMDPPR